MTQEHGGNPPGRPPRRKRALRGDERGISRDEQVRDTLCAAGMLRHDGAMRLCSAQHARRPGSARPRHIHSVSRLRGATLAA